MAKASRSFQVFVKPIGHACNLACHYCYYRRKEELYKESGLLRMPDSVLEDYIVQHIRACSDPAILFSWHGGEPTLLGVEFFRKVVSLQKKHRPRTQRIVNGIQTNGTLLDESWCQFLAEEEFSVGISLDGPEQIHDLHRVTKGKGPTYKEAMRGYELLQKHHISCDILCVVQSENVKDPLGVYRFFKGIGAQSISFLPLVEPELKESSGVSKRSVPAEALGHFLCAIFEEWKREDIEKVKVEIFEEIARTAFGQEPALCIFRKTCGDVPVVEHHGDFFSCDHFVDQDHCLGNIQQHSLVDLLESPAQRNFGEAKWRNLPQYCRSCEVLDLCYGGCPKDRILRAPDGEEGLNYLCPGYKRFFKHCKPFLSELSTLWKKQSVGGQASVPEMRTIGVSPKIGRNDPCPCGSGKKYKKCCLGLPSF